MKYSLYSWNVNGIRAAERKGFLDWLQKVCPYYLGVQETKAQRQQLSPQLIKPKGYHSFWNSAVRKGYSGVASFCREGNVSVSHGMGVEGFDSEGRVIITEFEQFIVLNVYFPNGRSRQERLKYKMDFCDAFLEFMGRLKKNKKKPLIVCGDLNTAHKEIDLARPKENEGLSGFLPQERAWMDDLVSWGMIDSFRAFDQQPENYTWWDFKIQIL